MCEAFEQLRIHWDFDKPSDSVINKRMQLKSNKSVSTQVPHSPVTLQCSPCSVTLSTVSHLPYLHSFTTQYSKNQVRKCHQREPAIKVCNSLLLIKAVPHTSGWYLQSADSQLLVCFYIKPKSRHLSWAAQASPSVQVTLVVLFFSDASVQLSPFFLKEAVTSLKLLQESSLRYTPVCELLTLLHVSHDGKHEIRTEGT